MYENTPRSLQDLGNGLYAYVQGDGSWGWSNSGLITAGDESLMIDTLFTGRLTEDLLKAYRRATPAADSIDLLVNTHANGDHTFGNHLVSGARIIGSTACAAEMEERPAPAFLDIMQRWRDHGAIGAFMHETMGVRFDFSDIGHAPPTELFDGRKTLQLGDRRIELVELGPAHTRGDIVVHVPDAKTVFTGDIVFSGGHPIIWAGPIGNWIQACELILSWDVETVVPGHGPIRDLSVVRDLHQYFTYVRDAASARFDAGQPWDEAAWDIGLEAFDSWLDRERIVANVANVYGELSGGAIAASREEILGAMLRHRHGAACPHEGPCGCSGGQD